MPWLFAICRMNGGLPDINTAITPVKGWAHCDTIGNQGAYLFSGTGAQLIALNALPQVVGLVAMTDSGIKWAELDGVISVAVRNKINTWLSARGLQTIPAGWTYKRTLLEIYRRFNERFDIDGIFVTDQ